MRWTVVSTLVMLCGLSCSAVFHALRLSDGGRGGLSDDPSARLNLVAGAFYVMDRGYLDFERLYALDQAGGFFVTRAKRNLDARRVYSAPVDRDTGLICDQTIALNGFYAAKHYPAHLRRIRYQQV